MTMAAVAIGHRALHAALAAVGVAAHAAAGFFFLRRFDCTGGVKSLVSVDLAVSALASALSLAAAAGAALALALGSSATFACCAQVATPLVAAVLGQAVTLFMSAFRLVQWRSECKGLPHLDDNRQVLVTLAALATVLVVAMSVPVEGSAIVPLPIAGCALSQENYAQEPYKRFAVFELMTWSVLIVTTLALDFSYTVLVRRRRKSVPEEETAEADAFGLDRFKVPVCATSLSASVFLALLLVPILALVLDWTENTLVLVGVAVGVAVQAARAPVAAMITLKTYLSEKEKAAQKSAREARRKKEIAMAIERRNVKKRKP